MHHLCGRYYVGDIYACFYGDNDEWAVVHACPLPCFHHAVTSGARHDGSMIVAERGSHLFLNVRDWEQPPPDHFMDTIISRLISFVDAQPPSRAILFHCHVGISRSPSLALIMLAREGHISDSTYASAKRHMQRTYPFFFPSSGIEHHLRKRWDSLCTDDCPSHYKDF